MTSASDLTRMVPGFDFLQGLMKGGGAGLPGIGQWIAPTLEPAELQKRIDELRTVQFWLDQNSKLLGTTIQALEVQRMTLATLQGMNLHMTDLADALKVKPADAPAPAAKAASPFGAARQPEPDDDEEAEPEPTPGTAEKSAQRKAGAKAKPGAAAAGAVDPMQWWGALTQQFTELATKALKDGGGEVARNLAGAAGAPAATAAQGLQAAAETSIERMMALSSQAAELAAQTGNAMAGAMGAATRGAGARAATGGADSPVDPGGPGVSSRARRPANKAAPGGAASKSAKSASAPAAGGRRRRGP